jgi:hypothetical protein
MMHVSWTTLREQIFAKRRPYRSEANMNEVGHDLNKQKLLNLLLCSNNRCRSLSVSNGFLLYRHELSVLICHVLFMFQIKMKIDEDKNVFCCNSFV